MPEGADRLDLAGNVEDQLDQVSAGPAPLESNLPRIASGPVLLFGDFIPRGLVSGLSVEVIGGMDPVRTGPAEGTPIINGR